MDKDLLKMDFAVFGSSQKGRKKDRKKKKGKKKNSGIKRRSTRTDLLYRSIFKAGLRNGENLLDKKGGNRRKEKAKGVRRAQRSQSKISLSRRAPGEEN